MTIRPGTLCIVIPPAHKTVGRICTVTSGPLTLSARTYYSVKFLRAIQGSTSWHIVPRYLRPLDDPDHAPAGPDNIKRKEPA